MLGFCVYRVFCLGFFVCFVVAVVTVVVLGVCFFACLFIGVFVCFCLFKFFVLWYVNFGKACLIFCLVFKILVRNASVRLKEKNPADVHGKAQIRDSCYTSLLFLSHSLLLTRNEFEKKKRFVLDIAACSWDEFSSAAIHALYTRCSVILI